MNAVTKQQRYVCHRTDAAYSSVDNLVEVAAVKPQLHSLHIIAPVRRF
jgi:hypothetical protein